MKALLLLAAIGTVGYFVHRDFFAEPETVEQVSVAARLPFGVRSAVQSLYEEWKRRQLGEPRASMADPEKLLVEVRRFVFSKGEHTEAAVKRTIEQALGELGIAPGDRQHVATEVLSMRNTLSDDRVFNRKRKEKQW